jgi:hypothetical protein
MKTFAHYDSTGAIHSLVVVDGPAGVTAMLEPEPGILVDEVEGVKPAGLDVDELRAFAETHRVARQQARPRKLVKK